jgi:peptide/nickel transport system substrate-binding protein
MGMAEIGDFAQDRGRTRRIVIGIAIAMTLIVAACGGGDDDGSGDGGAGDSAADVQTGGKLTFGIPGETDGYIPQVNRWGPGAFNVARAVYDPLAVNDPEGVARPYLVESIEPANDFTEWRISMRDEEIMWHNGEPLTADDIATNLKQHQLSPLTSNLYDPVDSIVVQTDNPDPAVDWDIQVNLAERWATFPSVLTGQTGYMAYPGTIEVASTKPDPIGTGPFRFDEWVPDDHTTVTRSDNYWRKDEAGNQLPYLNEIEFRPIIDPQSRQNALETGEIDVLLTNGFSEVVDIVDNPPDGKEIIEDTSEGDEVLIMFNTAGGPTGDGPSADVDVRRALALAIDKEALDEQLYGGYFPTADLPFQPDSTWYSDPDWPDPDKEEAKSLVDDWEAENGDLEIDVLTIQNQDNLEVIQVIQAMADEVGITINVEPTDEAGFALAVVEGSFDALLVPFFNRSDIDAEYHYIDPFRTGREGDLPGLVLNLARYTSEVTQDALPAARQTDDVDARAEEYAKVWKDWAENFPYIFLFQMELLVVADNTVHGLDEFTFPDGKPAQPIDWGATFLTDVWIEQ